VDFLSPSAEMRRCATQAVASRALVCLPPSEAQHHPSLPRRQEDHLRSLEFPEFWNSPRRACPPPAEHARPTVAADLRRGSVTPPYSATADLPPEAGRPRHRRASRQNGLAGGELLPYDRAATAGGRGNARPTETPAFWWMQVDDTMALICDRPGVSVWARMRYNTRGRTGSNACRCRSPARATAAEGSWCHVLLQA